MPLKHICLILNWNYCIDSPCLTELFCSLHLFYKVILTKNYFVLAPLSALYAPGSSAARHFPVPFVHLARQLQDCTAGVKIGRPYAAAVEEFGWLPVSGGQQAGCCGWYWCQGKFLFRIVETVSDVSEIQDYRGSDVSLVGMVLPWILILTLSRPMLHQLFLVCLS